MENKRIVFLGGRRKSTKIAFNFLNSQFGIHTAIIEDHQNSIIFIKRRIKNVGFITFFGELFFQLIIVNILYCFSRKRIDEIIKLNELNTSEIPSKKKQEVRSINSDIAIQLLKEINPDLIVISGTRIISKKVLNSVNCKFINIHAGITPKYRGVHGAYWALINDDIENVGVTVHFVDPGIDTGSIITQASITPSRKDNYITYPLLQLSEGLKILKPAIEDYFNGKLQPKIIQGDSNLWFQPTICAYLYYRLVKKVK